MKFDRMLALVSGVFVGFALIDKSVLNAVLAVYFLLASVLTAN